MKAIVAMNAIVAYVSSVSGSSLDKSSKGEDFTFFFSFNVKDTIKTNLTAICDFKNYFIMTFRPTYLEHSSQNNRASKIWLIRTANAILKALYLMR